LDLAQTPLEKTLASLTDVCARVRRSEATEKA